MQIRILLFGPLETAAGRGHITVEAGPAPTCRDISAAFARAYPALSQMAPAGRLAVNGEFAAPDQRIGENDEVALIALVAGG